MSLFDKVQEDYRETVLNLDEFGEEITYISAPKPYKLVDIEDDYITDSDDDFIGLGLTEESEKTIKALAFRDVSVPNEQNAGRITTREMEIIITCDGTYGIEEVKRGEDKVMIPVYKNQTPVEFCVGAILEKDDAIYRLLLVR